MIKKSITIALIACIISNLLLSINAADVTATSSDGYIEVSNSVETIIPAKDNATGTWGNGGDPNGKSKSGVEWTQGFVVANKSVGEVTYNITVAEDGYFNIHAVTGYPNNGGSKAAFTIYDGETIIVNNKEMEYSSDYYNALQTDLGRVFLSAGDHTIKVVTNSGSFYFYGFKFIPFVFGEEDLIFSTMNCETDAQVYTGVNNKNTEFDLPTTCLSFNNGNSVSIKINIPENAMYEITTYMGLQNKDATATITVKEGTENLFDSKVFGVEKSSYYYALRTVAGIREFTAGEHTLTFEMTNGSAFFFAVGINQIQGQPNPFIVDKSTDCVISNNDLKMVPKSYVTYKGIIGSSGRYFLSVDVKAEEDTFINLSSNAEALANIEIAGSDDYITCGTYVNLPAGEVLLKLFLAGSSADVRSFNILKIDENDESGFLTALYNAKTESRVLEAFENYATKIGIDLGSILDGIWYKKGVYMQMANRRFDSVEDALNTLLVLAESEKTNPRVKLLKDGEQIDSFVSGNISIEINNSNIIDNESSFVAIYENIGECKRLLSVDIITKNDSGVYVANFPELTIDDPDKITWKLICFKDSKKADIYDPYKNIYKEFYVAPGGDDNDPGTREAPFATISKAKNAAAQISDDMIGDIIINITPGEYLISETEEFMPEHSGKNGYNIVYRGTNTALENPPVISGGKRVTGWSEYKDGIYKASLDGVTDVRNLYINGIAAERSRTSWTYTYLEDYDDDTTSYKEGFVTSTTGGFPNLIKPQNAELVWEITWRQLRHPIKEIKDLNGKKVVVTDAEYFYEPLGKNNVTVGTEYYIENDLALIDTPGEFYYDKDQKVIYYYPYDDEKDNLNTTIETVVSVTEGLVSVNGINSETKISNIVFDNLSFKYGAWNDVSTVGFIGYQSDSIYDAEKRDETKGLLMLSQFEMNYAENIKITNCEFSSLDSAAISMKDGVEDVVFEGNIIKDVSGTGIIIGNSTHEGDSSSDICQNILIKNNVLRRVATEYRQNAAISVYYENAIKIENNDISGTPYSGISAGWGWEDISSRNAMCRNLTITGNKITDVLATLNDGGNIYTLGANYEGKIVNNHLEKNNSSSYPGIYLDAGSSYLNVHDNLVLNNESVFLLLQNEKYMTTHNNVYDNYSDTQQYYYVADVENNEPYNSIEEAIYPYADDGATLVAEAKSIADKAGLEADYVSLLEKVEAPSYIRDYIHTKPKHEDPLGILIDGMSFVEKSESVKVYTDQLGLNPNDSLTYILSGIEEGTYEILLEGKDVGDEDVWINIKINNSLLGSYEQFEQSADTKGKREIVSLGTINLTAGENTAKLTVISGAMHLYNIILREVK